MNTDDTIDLGGCSLVVTLGAFFIPQPNDDFNIVNCNSLISVFSNTFVDDDGRTLINANSGTLEVTYNAQSIILSNFCRDDLDADVDGVCNVYDVCPGRRTRRAGSAYPGGHLRGSAYATRVVSRLGTLQVTDLLQHHR